MEIPNRQVQYAPPGYVGENENGKADQLGYGGGQGCAGNTHIQSENEDRVKDTVQNAADAHAEHGEDCAALTAQTLIHYKAGRHKGRCQQHIACIVDRILLAGRGSAQQPHHGGHKHIAEDQQQRSQP